MKNSALQMAKKPDNSTAGQFQMPAKRQQQNQYQKL